MLLKLIMTPFLSYMLLVSLTKIVLSSKETLFLSKVVISSSSLPKLCHTSGLLHNPAAESSSWWQAYTLSAS